MRNKSDQTRERILSSTIAHDKYDSPSVSMSIYILKSADYIRFRQQQPPGPIRKVIGRLLEHFRTSSSARHRQLFVFRTALDLLCSFARSKSADDGSIRADRLIPHFRNASARRPGAVPVPATCLTERKPKIAARRQRAQARGIFSIAALSGPPSRSSTNLLHYFIINIFINHTFCS